MKTCKFIRTNNEINSIFVPRPTSVFGGWARHQWLKSYFKQECSIAGPALWQTLIERHGPPKILIEEAGEFREENEE